MNLADLLDGLADALKVTGARDVLPYTPESASAFPLLFIGSPSGQYGRDYDGDVTMTVAVWLLLGASDMKRSQADIWPFIDPTGDKSVPAAVHAHPTLGLSGVDARVVGWQEPGVVELAGGSYVGLRFDVEVLC